VVLGTLTPGGDTARDWNSRWQSIQAELKSLSDPEMETMSGDTIFARRDRRCIWYVLASQYKDALKDAASTLGIVPHAIEKAINSDPRLALLADLANQDKHINLKDPRSGDVPKIGKPSGSDVLPRGWILQFPIDHDSQTLDGLEIARAAMTAWREALESWRLI
jgi:hypothetical protein